jgi:hypothetical protein
MPQVVETSLGATTLPWQLKRMCGKQNEAFFVAQQTVSVHMTVVRQDFSQPIWRNLTLVVTILVD